MILKTQVYSEHVIEYIGYVTEVSKVYLLLKTLWSTDYLALEKLDLFYLY